MRFEIYYPKGQKQSLMVRFYFDDEPTTTGRLGPDGHTITSNGGLPVGSDEDIFVNHVIAALSKAIYGNDMTDHMPESVYGGATPDGEKMPMDLYSSD